MNSYTKECNHIFIGNVCSECGVAWNIFIVDKANRLERELTAAQERIVELQNENSVLIANCNKMDNDCADLRAGWHDDTRHANQLKQQLAELEKERDEWKRRYDVRCAAAEQDTREEVEEATNQLKQQLAAMELAVGAKDEALKTCSTDIYGDNTERYGFNSALVEKALSTEPSELYRKVVEVLSDLIAACPHEAEGQQRAMAALKGRELLQLLNAKDKP